MTTDATPATQPPDPMTSVPSADIRAVVVELEYKHHHHIPSEAEYPSEEALHAKVEENLVAGLWRLHIARKQPVKIAINTITLKGIEHPTDAATNLDADDLERAVLSVCYREAAKFGARATYQVRFMFKVAPGQRTKKREVSFEIGPLPDGPDLEDEAPGEGATEPPQGRWDQRARRWDEQADRVPPPPGSPFQERYSPFPGQRPPDSWRDRVVEPTRRFDPNDEANRAYQHGLQQRRRHLFSTDMVPQLHLDNLSADAQREYASGVLPYMMLNNSMGLSYQAFAAAFDMMSTANHENSRLHSLQMAQMIDRENKMMEVLMRMHDGDAERREHHASQIREGHQAYLEALRLRGEINQRELAYERQYMQSQFQVGEAQRALHEQQERHQKDQGDTFRRDMVRGMGPVFLQGLATFLDYFGQQKAGQGARVVGSFVSNLIQNSEQQRPPGQPHAPGAPGMPGPHAPPPRARPSERIVDVSAVPRSAIPRRSLRLRDVATDDEIATQPVRALCRMVDHAFTDSDRARMQQILSPHEWSNLEQTLRAQSDQDCLAGLASMMLSLAGDEHRKAQMLASLTAGQRELFEKIASFMNGNGALDPDYEIDLRPVSRMRTVVERRAADADEIPTPPPDLDDALAQGPATTRPTIPIPPKGAPEGPPEATPESVPEDVPRPTARAPQAPSKSLEQILLEKLDVMQEQIQQVRQDGAKTIDSLRAEIEGLRGRTNPVQDPVPTPADTPAPQKKRGSKRGGSRKKEPVKTDG